MKPFWISEITERHGEKTLYINPLPEKYCTFDCVFCPIEIRTAKKTDQALHFKESAAFLLELERKLSQNKVDTVFIMPDGEGLANADLASILILIKNHDCKSKIITNGYIINDASYRTLLLQFDEVIGELMTATEEDFHALQRPIAGYTLKAYVDNMAAFRQDFKGSFDLSITLLKSYSDSDAALQFFKEAVAKIKPNHVFIETPEDGKLQEAFGVAPSVIERFENELNLL